MRRRICRAAIIACLGIAMLAYGALEKRVTVEIEGRPVSVRTFAATVGGVLQRAGIPLGPQDRVVPGPRASIADGGVVRVLRAKPITLLLDGKPKRVVVTGLTIEEVIEEISLRGSLADSVHPSRGERVVPGMTITYRRAVALAVLHDDETERVITNAPTIGDLVRELGIKLGKRDLIQPRLSARPTKDMTVRVLRVGIKRETRHVEVPYSTILRRTSGMEYGTRRIAQHGRHGLRRIRYLARYVDGVRVSRRVLGSNLLRPPSSRIILIGSGFPGCVCNRGTQAGKATWYSQADGLSAAHRTLPLGTVVRVENLANGRWVNVVIRDRGPYGDGRIIDLSDEAFRRIASLGTGVITVRIWW